MVLYGKRYILGKSPGSPKSLKNFDPLVSGLKMSRPAKYPAKYLPNANGKQVDMCGPPNKKINQNQLDFEINIALLSVFEDNWRKMTLKAKVESPSGRVLETL